jgi:hypothetical protein
MSKGWTVNRIIKTNKFRSERGIGDLMAVVIGLPIIIMMVAFLYNLLQGPYIQRTMRGALAEITASAANEAAKDDSLSVRPIDSNEPAGNQIFPVSAVVAPNTNNAGPGILTPTMEESLVTEACKLSAKYLNGFVSSERAFEFGIVKLYSTDKSGANATLSMNVEYALMCPQNSLSDAGLGSDAFSVAKAAEQLKSRFHDLPGIGSGLWAIDKFNKVANVDDQVTYLPSYWMVGVVTGKTTALASAFFGSSKYISDYHIHPFSAPVGIQSSLSAHS